MAQLSASPANFQAADQKVQASERHIAERTQDIATADINPALVATARSSTELLAGDIKKSKAALLDAPLNLSYTRIVASVSGTIGRRSIETGQRVALGQLLPNIVPSDDLWVTANYKET